MCFMEGQGVDGHVGDESSPYRKTFVLPPLPLPHRVSRPVLCWCARVLACRTLTAVSLRTAGAQQLYQVKRMLGGIGNMLFSTCSQTLNV